MIRRYLARLVRAWRMRRFVSRFTNPRVEEPPIQGEEIRRAWERMKDDAS